MPVVAGDKLGVYEILGLLGKGGMGEVYRARDTKLNRQVAIKVLAPAFAQDGDYRVRFEREAQVLASLNHPNIAAIYGLDGNAIVMELVDGDSPRGPMPVPEVLAIARQIAEALEAAHERGIVHRDLKPGNVKVTPEGVVKVLDFGLAKAVQQTPAAVDGDSPTMRPTEAGLILGTAAYMSPEQAAGKPVDRRADIWAFGVVLYELLTGQKLFHGETVSDTLADVLRKEIDLSKLPAETPTAIRELIRRCLDRNLKNRLSWISEARFTIDRVGDKPETTPAAKRSPWPWIAATAVLTVAFAALAFVHFTAPKPQEPYLRSFSFTPKDVSSDTYTRRAAISPDGHHIAYAAGNKLWVRTLESEQARAIEGTDGAEGPFWSPDSAQIGFAAGGELKKVALNGGTPFTLARLNGNGFRGGAWSPDGRTILVSTLGQGLSEIPAGGGAWKVVAPMAGGNYYLPSYPPSAGQRRLAVAGHGSGFTQTLVLVDLDTGKSETLRAPGANPAWSPGGYVLYQTDARTPGFQALRVSTTGKVEGEPVSLRNEGSDLSASADGTLLWMDAALASRRLTWRDRGGKKLADTGLPPSADIRYVALSPDGTQAAWAATGQGNLDIWTAELARGVRTRLTFAPQADLWPVWSPTGREIAFASLRNGNYDIFMQVANGSGEPRPVVASPDNEYPDAWSPDGTTLVFRRTGAKTGNDLWAVKRKAGGTFEPPSVWLQTPFDELRAVFSPDGQYVAYQSDESGRNEVYVRPSGGGGGKWQISTAGGINSRWSGDGREIFYGQGETLMAAPVSIAGEILRPGTPVKLFRNRAFTDIFRPWDAHPDGKRFLIAEEDESDGKSSSIHLIENWPALLRGKAPR